MRTSRLFLFLALAATAQAAPPPELWPLQPNPAKIKTLFTGAKDLPAGLQPAVQFQRSFCDILGGAPVTAWRTDLEKLARQAGDDPVTQGVREVAKVWLARVAMQDIEAVLNTYYRHHVGFPDSLVAVEKELSENLQVDPWGQPWAYALRAPKGFARQTNQRYDLSPARFPKLLPLAEAVKDRRPPAIPWKIIQQGQALQFKSTTVSALIQPGGAVDGCLLLFMGDGWALMAGLDQLFTITY